MPSRSAPVRRVLVVGPGGAGKSTFSTRLAERTGLPVVHLDAHYWRPGWVAPDPEEWTATVDRLMAEPAWIMDGNYGGTLERRLPACDTVVFLDMPRAVCLRRVIWRWLRFRGTVRPDMGEGCPDHLTWAFLRWIWRYPTDRRPRMIERLGALRADQRAVVLRSDDEVEAFLASVPAGGLPLKEP